MPAQRHDSIDALRGLALLWMAAFHLGFDLHQFGVWRQDFYSDPVWTWQRTCILSLFLFCAGMGQAIALAQGQPWGRFWRRWGQIAGCAMLVTAGSWWMFPHSFIHFGVLHGMAVMLLIARVSGGAGRWLWVMGALAIAAKFAGAAILSGTDVARLFNGGWLNWMGLITVKPRTEDYVPVLPWLGVMWWGMAAGQWLLGTRPPWLARPMRGAAASLALLGRWSLSFYMLHQPLMIGVLMLLVPGRF